ncbi:hypothetical protein D3C74_331470 [compost metagenome]
MGLEGVRALSFNNILFLNIHYSENGTLLSVLIYYLVITAMGLSAGWVSWRRFNGKSLSLGVRSNDTFHKSGQQAL